MSSNVENEYFSDGITEEIINVLSKIEGLKVTSRTSSFFFKGKNIPIPEIGEQLRVSTILEGSVRLSGDNIRITAQLIQTKEDFHFWSETWDRKKDDIFKIQDEVALAVAEKTRERIGHFEIDETKERTNASVSAYELYLKSKSNFYKFQKNDIFIAIDQIQEAIEMDAACPFYYASKSIYFGFLGVINAIPKQEAFTVSKRAAKNAIRLDETDAEANYSLGMVSYFFEKDLDKAHVYIDLALKYRPNYASALLGGSVLDTLTGKHERAITRVKKALEIDPLSPANIYYHAAALLRSGQREEALIKINVMLKLMPHNTNAYCLKGIILTRLKRYDEAIEHYKTVPIDETTIEIYYAGIGIVYATQGELIKAKEYLAKSIDAAQNLFAASQENAKVIINIYLGNFDLAFEEIEKDIKAQEYYLNFYQENPAFELVSADSRYKIFDTVFKTKGISKQSSKAVQSAEMERLTTSRMHEKKNLIEEDDIELFRNQLLHYIKEETPYLDVNLSLRSLANQMNMAPNKLSWLLNNSIEKNFNEFINHYRIEAFKKLAKDPVNANITILGLAYECGFNSKSVFNMYFKKETGQTPRAFLKP
jgi:TolB-like protein/AraC-like DNA-binding protein/Tfp pilus assembly protein PilF